MTRWLYFETSTLLPPGSILFLTLNSVSIFPMDIDSPFLSLFFFSFVLCVAWFCIVGNQKHGKPPCFHYEIRISRLYIFIGNWAYDQLPCIIKRVKTSPPFLGLPFEKGHIMNCRR